MKTPTINVNLGPQWIFVEPLEDVDIVDNTALLAEHHQYIQANTDKLVSRWNKLGLKTKHKKDQDDEKERATTINNSVIEVVK